MQPYNIIWAVGVMVFSLYLGISLIIVKKIPSFLLSPTNPEESMPVISGMVEHIGFVGSGAIVIFFGAILAVLCLLSRNDTVG